MILRNSTPSSLAELRVDPGDEARDLFWGVGGQRYASLPEATYTQKAKDETGFSISFDAILLLQPGGETGVSWEAKKKK